MGRDINLLDSKLKGSEWIELGFQCEDPASDFRGTGELGLYNLYYLVTSQPQKSIEMLTEANKPEIHYFFACAGINITLKLLFLITKDHMQLHKFTSATSSDDALQRFNIIYVEFFEEMHEYWTQSPLNVSIMNYNTVINEFFQKYKTQNK